MKKTSKSHIFDDEQSNEAAGDRDFVTNFFEKQTESYSAQFDPNVRSGAAVLFQLRRRLAVEMSSRR